MQEFQYLEKFLDEDHQVALLHAVNAGLELAPFFRPSMPRSGRPFSVEMSNFGPLGWISDKAGYRYQRYHPLTCEPWPPIPDALIALWRRLVDYPALPEACLVNYYGAGTRLGSHVDCDEEARDAPVLSVSLGDSAVFHVGGSTRRAKTHRIVLGSGDVVILAGASRHAYHGIDKVLFGSSQLIPGGGRINLTLRRVTEPAGG